MTAEYVINGSRITSEKSFYNEIEKVLTNGLNWKIGRNLDAFDDVLRGGFGQFKTCFAFKLRANKKAPKVKNS